MHCNRTKMSDFDVQPTYNNLGFFEVVHEDTDTGLEDVGFGGQKGISDDSSLEYEARGTLQRKSVSEDRIRKLVQDADNLVYGQRFGKARKWRSREEDSCDASGEDDERESLKSDCERSTSTLRMADNVAPAYYGRAGKRSTWYGSTPFEESKQMYNHFSISESALHSMSFSPNLSKEDGDSAHILVNGSNSTSSTVEEIGSHLQDNPSPNRRRRRKTKNMMGKSDPHLMSSSPKHHLLKSCSFPGNSMSLNRSTELSTTLVQNDTTTTSEAESEEDCRKKVPWVPDSSKTHYLANHLSEDPSSDGWDDSYLFDYSSEPYSESRDSDAARQLINFGEDYRKFIDSTSEFSAFSDASPTMRRKHKSKGNPLFSEFGSYDNCYRQLKENLDTSTTLNDIEDLMEKCDERISWFNNKSNYNDEHLDLQHHWKGLKERCICLSLEKQISDMRKSVVRLILPGNPTTLFNASPQEEIQAEIDTLKNLISNINVQLEKWSPLQAEVHRFVIQNPRLGQNSDLKNDILQLYDELKHAKNLSIEKLELIENLLPQWRILETRLEQLHKDLQDDDRNIDAIDSHLSKGTFSDKTATTVRELAKLLSKSGFNQGKDMGDFLTEGSFSDSGISDEGSEHEIGERQRRFAAIRRLVRQLETELPSESAARAKMRQRLENAELNLRKIQSRCRSLVVRTSACAGDDVSAAQTPDAQPDGPWYGLRQRKVFLAIQVIFITFGCLIYLFQPKCCDSMNNYKLSLSPKLHFEGRPPI